MHVYLVRLEQDHRPPVVSVFDDFDSAQDAAQAIMIDTQGRFSRLSIERVRVGEVQVHQERHEFARSRG